MTNIRSTRDEFMDIENRWRVIASREASLEKRERDVRLKEEQIRQFMNTNHPIAMAMPSRMSMPHLPTQPSLNTQGKQVRHNKKTRINRNMNMDKDYSQFAVVPRADTVMPCAETVDHELS